jgi:hypothetical protein
MTDRSNTIIDLTTGLGALLPLIGEWHLFYKIPCIRKIRHYYTYNNMQYF